MSGIHAAARTYAAGLLLERSGDFGILSGDMARMSARLMPQTPVYVVSPGYWRVGAYFAAAAAKAVVCSTLSAHDNLSDPSTLNALSSVLQEFWEPIRKIAAPRRRAPFWNEQHGSITRRRDYVQPLSWLMFGHAAVYGSHDGKWPRTKQSIEAWRTNRDDTIRWLVQWCPERDKLS